MAKGATAKTKIAEKLKECDGMVVGSPVYYASANGTLISFLDRLFYSSRFDKSMKVGTALMAMGVAAAVTAGVVNAKSSTKHKMKKLAKKSVDNAINFVSNKQSS